MTIDSLVIYEGTLYTIIGRKLDPNFFTISNYFPSNTPLQETVHRAYLSDTRLTPADLYVANIHSDADLLESYPELFI